MSYKIKISKIIICFVSYSLLFSCSNNLPSSKSKIENNKVSPNSETVTVDETENKSGECPEKPGKLNSSNVEKVNLDQSETTVSGQLIAGEALGYSFEGKENQKLTYSTEDEFCMWIYTPDNDILEGLELPTDGSYTVQISIPKGAKTFEIFMSLERLQPSESLNTSSITQEQSESSKSYSDVSSLISKPSGDIYNSIINDLADQIFYERHPELHGRKIQPNETAFIKEWKKIRNCEAIVDYKFYQRHPELKGKKIQPGETQLAKEWLRIKRRVTGCNLS